MSAVFPSLPGGSAERLRLWQRFHIRLTALYGLTVLVVLAAMGVAFYDRAERAAVARLQGQLLTTAVSLAQSVSPDLVTRLGQREDLVSAEYRLLVSTFAAVAAEQGDLMSIYVLKPTSRPGWLTIAADWAGDNRPALPGDLYDARQAPRMMAGLVEPTVEDEPYTDEYGTTLSAYAPVVGADGRRLGLVGVDLSLPALTRLRRGVLGLTLALYGLAGLLLGATAWAVGRHVRRPLGRIIAATEAIERGDYDARTGLERGDELGVVARRVDQVAAGLAERETIRATFGRFVSGDVVERLLADRGGTRLGGEEREVTVLFCRLEGYRDVAELLTPTQVVSLLNGYLSAMGEVVDHHGGCVLEFVGHEVLSVFNAPREVSGHAEAAVRCALAMRRRTVELLRTWRDELAETGNEGAGAGLFACLGLHTGPVVAGNLGSRRRLKYGIIGDTVNVAARTQALAARLGEGLLLTRETAEQLPPALRAEASPRGEHMVKGRAQPVEVLAL